MEKAFLRVSRCQWRRAGDKSGDDRDTRKKAFKFSGRHNPHCEAPRLSGAAGVKSYITLRQL